MKKFLVAVAFCALVFSSFSCSQLADDFSEEATPSYSSTGKSAAANTQSSNSTADTKSESKNASGSTESADSEAPSNNAAEEEVTETEQNAKNAENTVKEEENKNASDTTQSEEQQKAADNTAEEKTEQAEQKANGETPSDTSSGSKSPASSGSTPRENPQPKPSFNPPKSQTSGDSTGKSDSFVPSRSGSGSGKTEETGFAPKGGDVKIVTTPIDDSKYSSITGYAEYHATLAELCNIVTKGLIDWQKKIDASSTPWNVQNEANNWWQSLRNEYYKKTNEQLSSVNGWNAGNYLHYVYEEQLDSIIHNYIYGK